MLLSSFTSYCKFCSASLLLVHLLPAVLVPVWCAGLWRAGSALLAQPERAARGARAQRAAGCALLPPVGGARGAGGGDRRRETEWRAAGRAALLLPCAAAAGVLARALAACCFVLILLMHARCCCSQPARSSRRAAATVQPPPLSAVAACWCRTPVADSGASTNKALCTCAPIQCARACSRRPPPARAPPPPPRTDRPAPAVYCAFVGRPCGCGK